MSINVYWITDAALDWAVASIELTGHDDYTNVLMVTVGDDNDWKYNPSTDWAQGGAIIEREKIELAFRPRGNMESLHGDRKPDWAAGIYNPQTYKTDFIMSGHTPLIAAMRCYVVSKLGLDIDIPKELNPFRDPPAVEQRSDDAILRS